MEPRWDVAADGTNDTTAKLAADKAGRDLMSATEKLSELSAEAVDRAADVHWLVEDVEPETVGEADVYSVERTAAFLDEFVSAISILPGKAKSSAARACSRAAGDAQTNPSKPRRTSREAKWSAGKQFRVKRT